MTCVHTMDWLPVLGMFNVRTDVDMCHCTPGLLATDTITESALKMDWDKNRLPHRGIKPASVLRLASQSNALPTVWLHSRTLYQPFGFTVERSTNCLASQSNALPTFWLHSRRTLYQLFIYTLVFTYFDLRHSDLVWSKVM